MIFNLKHKKLADIMSSWWAQIVGFSHRDQLSLNYVLWKLKEGWFKLFDEKQSLRDHFDFFYLGHGNKGGYNKISLSRDIKTCSHFSCSRQHEKTFKRPGVDIVICVHNALEEVVKCLNSVLKSMELGDRIILVDDASSWKTRNYLSKLSRKKENIKLIQNKPKALGYSKSANIGMSHVENDYFLLLNSDTELSKSALDNMLRVMVADNNVGIVGPLSNAASAQSIPEIKNTTNQTAINEIPPGFSNDKMNELCIDWSSASIFPTVPLAHGFCQLIRTELYKKTGGFDIELFPEGYGEENDFCLRANDAGYDLKIATNAFVFHSKSASYKDKERRSRLMKEAMVKLKTKYGEDRIRQSVLIIEQHPLLESIKNKANNFFRLDKGK